MDKIKQFYFSKSRKIKNKIMGTSKANIGPVGYSEPIQSWNIDRDKPENENSNDSDNNDQQKKEEEEEKPGKWGDAKRDFSLFIKNPTKLNCKKFTTSYKKASGGVKKLSSSSIGGRKGAIVLLDFLTNISKEGLEETLQKFNIGDIKQLKAEGAINKLSNIFTDIDGTDEGSAATAAAIETINKLYNDYSETPEVLETLKIEVISEYLQFYISSYIFERISIEVSKALEDNKLTVNQVNQAEVYLKSYIEAEVKLNFEDVDFSTKDINQQNIIVKQIFNDAYSLI